MNYNSIDIVSLKCNILHSVHRVQAHCQVCRMADCYVVKRADEIDHSKHIELN